MTEDLKAVYKWFLIYKDRHLVLDEVRSVEIIERDIYRELSYRFFYTHELDIPESLAGLEQ